MSITEKDSKVEGAAKNSIIDCKPDLSLLPRSFKNQTAFAMMAGRMKYLTDNYRKGHNINELIAAGERHLDLIKEGEDIDADTTERLRNGCTDLNGVFNKGFGDKAPEVLHWACLAATALMAIEQIRLGTIKDNRYKKQEKKLEIDYSILDKL